MMHVCTYLHNSSWSFYKKNDIKCVMTVRRIIIQHTCTEIPHGVYQVRLNIWKKYLTEYYLVKRARNGPGEIKYAVRAIARNPCHKIMNECVPIAPDFPGECVQISQVSAYKRVWN